MQVTVIGSGSWGTAFSRLLSRNGHRVTVLTLTAEEAAELTERRVNEHFLPGVDDPGGHRLPGHRRGRPEGRRAARLRGAHAGHPPGRRVGRTAAAGRLPAAVARQGPGAHDAANGPRRSSPKRPARRRRRSPGPTTPKRSRATCPRPP